MVFEASMTGRGGKFSVLGCSVELRLGSKCELSNSYQGRVFYGENRGIAARCPCGGET